MRRTAARQALLSLPLAATFGLLLATGAAAHGGGTEPTVEVDPAQVTAGGKITIACENMEPNSDRVIVLAGQSLIVQFGTVKTDADGRLTLTATVPSHLPSGVYSLQAIGDETVSTQLQVTAAEGMASSAPAPQETVKPRPMDAIGWGVLALAVAAMVLIGGWLVLSAERLAGHRRA